MNLQGIGQLDVDPSQRYRFNGKEFDESVGLYDYGARYYDPAVGRWAGVDPLAEQYSAWSPFNYVLGNPVGLVDPDGRSVKDIIDIDNNTGRILITKTEGDDIIRLVSKEGVENDYLYGENGSFLKENNLEKKGDRTHIYFSSSDKAQEFYNLAAEAKVEYALLDVEKKYNGKKLSIVATSHLYGSVRTDDLIDEFSRMGYSGLRQSHTHPNGASFPSGYDYSSMMPLPESDVRYEGDAPNALNVKAKSGWENTKFEIYVPSKGQIIIYDGINKAKIN